MLTIVIILQTPNCMWFTNFTFTDGEVSLLEIFEIWRTKLPLRKNLNPGSLAWVASDLQRHLPWLRLHQGPPLEITRLSQNIQVTLCYLGRVIFTLNWDLGWFMFSWWNVFTSFLVSLSTGRASVFSPCGVAGGNPFGGWSIIIIQAFLKELELGTAFFGCRSIIKQGVQKSWI